MQFLIDHGESLTAVDKDLWQSIHCAAFGLRWELVSRSLSRKVLVGIRKTSTAREFFNWVLTSRIDEPNGWYYRVTCLYLQSCLFTFVNTKTWLFVAEMQRCYTVHSLHCKNVSLQITINFVIKCATDNIGHLASFYTVVIFSSRFTDRLVGFCWQKRILFISNVFPRIWTVPAGGIKHAMCVRYIRRRPVTVKKSIHLLISSFLLLFLITTLATSDGI